MDEDVTKWLKVCIAIGILILVTVGFVLGYLYSDHGCMENPLVYGMKQMNEANDDKFICSCNSKINHGDNFYFDEYGLRDQRLPFN